LALITRTSLPLFVTFLLRDMLALWRHPHRLVFWWLIVMQALFPRAENVVCVIADALVCCIGLSCFEELEQKDTIFYIALAVLFLR